MSLQASRTWRKNRLKESVLLNDNDLAKIQSVCSNVSNPVTLLVNGSALDYTGHPSLPNIAAQISGVSMNRVAFDYWDAPIFPDKPSITLAGGQQRNIHFLAMPENRELEPFLDAIAWLSGSAQPPVRSEMEALRHIKRPVELLVFMSGFCPHCPAVVRHGLYIATIQPLVDVSIIDATLFGDLAEKYKIKSTPTVIFNEGFTHVGELSLENLVKYVTLTDSPDFTTVTLDSMIKNGRAEDAALYLCKNRASEAVLPIFKAPEFSSRMGALLVMEEALSLDPRCLDAVVEPLTELLKVDETALRGDTAELLGKIGDPSASAALQALLETEKDPEVTEAAKEALERLEVKTQ